jgi:glycosyltransferase involved in cell wall biosynthesis
MGSDADLGAAGRIRLSPGPGSVAARAQVEASADVASDPQTVLLITPRWARDGGVGAHVQTSARELARRGFEVDVLVAEIADESSAGDVAVHCWPQLCQGNAYAHLNRHLPSRPDVIHVHQVDDPSLLAALVGVAPTLMSAHAYPACTAGVYYFAAGRACTRGHGPGCALNLAARGCAHTRHPQTLPRKYRNASRALAAFRQADLAISYSTAVDRHLAANGVARRRIVPLFITLPAPAAAPPPAPATPGPVRPLAVYAGRVVASKGVDVLLHAVAGVDVELNVCGDGRDLEAMRELARSLGIAERVHFKGWLDEDDLTSELQAATVVVVPSVWPEPFGLVGIEAMAAARPVIASGYGGITDWLNDGVTGLLFDPGDPGDLRRALTELIADPARAQAMGRAGRAAVAAHFTADEHCAALLGAYRAARSHWESRRAAGGAGAYRRGRAAG